MSSPPSSEPDPPAATSRDRIARPEHEELAGREPVARHLDRLAPGIDRPFLMLRQQRLLRTLDQYSGGVDHSVKVGSYERWR